MSAICGFLNLDSAPADPQLVAAQLARLKHLGPDGVGTFTSGPVALGHRLLSITPESVQETSPWRSADGQRVIAFDGRLDHREDLCAALGVPHTERNVPDPELILRAHEKWGTDCAAKLEGEFAFALWDARQRELFCACDAFAQRLLYYHCTPTRFTFASMIRGVLAVPGVPQALDELTLACRLGGVPRLASRTLYAGIARLPCACVLTLRPGGQPQIRRYWHLGMEPEIRLCRPEEYVEALREMIGRAVRSAVRTRHPVAAMLSGGLDSTGVAGLTARELAGRGQRLVTVSNILPDDFQGSEWGREESGFIRSALAMHPNMDPQWSRGLALPVVDFDDEFYEHQDEPDPDAKSFRTAELVHLARQAGARILLGGSGGDMSASFKGTGYLEHLARTGRWLELARQIRLQAQNREMPSVGIFRREVLRPLVPAWLRRWNDQLRNPRNAEYQALAIHPEFAERMQVVELRRAAGWGNGFPQDFRRAQVPLVNTGQLGGGDNWAATYSSIVESPQPLMDRRLWDWCHRVPVGEFIRDGMPRSLYRQALHDVLPAEILRRTSKGWFAPDFQPRLAACIPAMETFLAQHPASDPVWAYVHRPSVVQTLERLASAPSKHSSDHRFQLILCYGLRFAHFVAWLGKSGPR